MNVICLEDEAFYALIEKVLARFDKQSNLQEDQWISDEEAMRRLRITSKTTLQKFRDEGKIRFSSIAKKKILYDSKSITEFLEQNAKNTF